ncbi:branched-chain amino acid ABC transporter permease [Oceanibacterium hippocampi]|uniref:Leucine/isoleucine/valine transporter permease subunit n=1 Tax=Oceanibacterium hippocampi TaxID=745714 RepID=A0A1Y5TRJ4_9PROT|nr:branched-chain amino acid ABC transporter permease [Oceanibacterium hippocampi]SLN70460.1 leucine/isoleucine/valine transporter permease subunit [Oceanibacterium hippocampi]
MSGNPTSLTAPAGGRDSGPLSRNWRLLTAAAVAVAAGIAAPHVISSVLWISLLTQAVVDMIFATSVGLLVRQNGRISFGQAAFFGLGGYIFAVSIAREIATPELAIILAVVLPTLIAFLLGLIIARIPGVAHAMLTLAVGQAFYEVVFKWRELANGDDGMSVALPRTLFGFDSGMLQTPGSMLPIVWTILVMILVGFTLMARSPFGQLTEAIRENDERAQFIGYTTTLPRAVIYGASAFVAAVAGLLQTLYNGYISPDMFHWSLSGMALIMAIVGGPKIIWGPALGAFILFFFKDVAGDATEYWPALVGIMLIVVTLLLPEGFAGLAERTDVPLRRLRKGRAS